MKTEPEQELDPPPEPKVVQRTAHVRVVLNIDIPVEIDETDSELWEDQAYDQLTKRGVADAIIADCWPDHLADGIKSIMESWTVEDVD